MCRVSPAPLCVNGPAPWRRGASCRCVSEGSMSAMEQTRYRQSLGSNALAFDERRRDLQPAPSTDSFATDSPADDPIPLFLSDLRDQPDPRELAPARRNTRQPIRQPTRQRTIRRTSILAPIAAGGMVISAFAIMVAVFNSDVTRALIDKATAFMAGAAGGPSAVQAATNQPAARQLKDDPARVSDPGTRATGNTSVPRSETASREDMARDERAALQNRGSGPTYRE